MYFDGLGVARNHTKARKWFRKAAAQGNNKARRNLATMSGRGSFQNRDAWNEKQRQIMRQNDRELGHAYFGM